MAAGSAREAVATATEAVATATAGLVVAGSAREAVATATEAVATATAGLVASSHSGSQISPGEGEGGRGGSHEIEREGERHMIEGAREGSYESMCPRWASRRQRDTGSQISPAWGRVKFV